MSFHRNARGSDLHAPSNELVENNTGVTIPKLHVVHFNGYGTTFPQVVTSTLAADLVSGVTQADMATGTAGYICSLGLLINVDTSAWAVNTTLYTSATGALSPTPYGFPVALVMRQDAVLGVMYVDNTMGLNNSLLTGAWFTIGNHSLNPDPLIGNFLGTIDAIPVRMRTDNVHRMTIDENGRFGLGQETSTPLDFFFMKAHTGYPLSGHRENTFAVTTNSGALAIAYSFQVPTQTTAMITVKAVGRQQNAAAHCAFKRTVCVSLESIQAVIEGLQSDFTAGGPGFNVSFTVNMDTILFNVQNVSGLPTNWSGSVEIEVIS